MVGDEGVGLVWAEELGFNLFWGLGSWCVGGHLNLKPTPILTALFWGFRSCGSRVYTALYVHYPEWVCKDNGKEHGSYYLGFRI